MEKGLQIRISFYDRSDADTIIERIQDDFIVKKLKFAKPDERGRSRAYIIAAGRQANRPGTAEH